MRLAKTLFLRQKCFIDTGCVCTSSVAKESRHQMIGENPFIRKKAYQLVMYTSAS
jgi:hypothetical protein